METWRTQEIMLEKLSSGVWFRVELSLSLADFLVWTKKYITAAAHSSSSQISSHLTSSLFHPICYS